MNRIGIHYGCFVTNWRDEQFGLIEKVGNMGFNALELGYDYLLDKDEKGRREIREHALEQDVEMIMSLGMAPHHDISSSDSSVRQAGINALHAMAETMAACGITECCGVVYCQWNRTASSMKERDEAWNYSVASMKEAVKAFSDNGVYLNVEPTNRFENSLINSCGQALEYIEAVGSGNIGIHLDTFHMNIEENSFVEPIFQAGDKLRYFHIGENNRKMPGTGMLPWKTIFGAVKAAGYKGTIVMEPFIRPVGEIGPAVSLYRNVADLSRYDDDIVQSLQFVRTLLS